MFPTMQQDFQPKIRPVKETKQNRAIVIRGFNHPLELHLPGSETISLEYKCVPLNISFSNIKGTAAERAINHPSKHFIVKTHNPLRLKWFLCLCWYVVDLTSRAPFPLLLLPTVTAQSVCRWLVWGKGLLEHLSIPLDHSFFIQRAYDANFAVFYDSVIYSVLVQLLKKSRFTVDVVASFRTMLDFPDLQIRWTHPPPVPHGGGELSVQHRYSFLYFSFNRHKL